MLPSHLRKAVLQFVKRTSGTKFRTSEYKMGSVYTKITNILPFLPTIATFCYKGMGLQQVGFVLSSVLLLTIVLTITETYRKNAGLKTT